MLKSVQRTAVWRRVVNGLWVPLHTRYWRRLQSDRAFELAPTLGVVAPPAQRLPGSSLSQRVCHEILGMLERGAFENAKRAVRGAAADPLAFSADITTLLPVGLRRDLVGLAMEPDVLDWVVRYFGFVPHLNDVSLYLNFPVPGLGEEGSKLWHRDNGDADGKQVTMFIAVTPIHEGNGPLYYLEKRDLTYHAHLPAQRTEDSEMWRHGRISNDVVASVGGHTHSLVGSRTGDRLLMDTLTVYHKGGWCRSDDRLFVSATFQAEGYSSRGRQDLSQLCEWTAAEMATRFPSPLLGFVLGLDGRKKVGRAASLGHRLFYRLNRSVFTYRFTPSAWISADAGR